MFVCLRFELLSVVIIKWAIARMLELCVVVSQRGQPQTRLMFIVAAAQLHLNNKQFIITYIGCMIQLAGVMIDSLRFEISSSLIVKRRTIYTALRFVIMDVLLKCRLL